MRKISTMLMLMVMLVTGVSAWAAESEEGHVTTVRNWDFTQGQKHADEVTDCEYWSASSKGRYALAKALEDQVLPSNTGGALTDLDGVYFTIGSGAVYGITQNFCLQNGKMTVRIPNCGINDTIIVDFSGAGGEATVVSDNILKDLTMPSNISKQCDESKVSTLVKGDGEVVLNMSCGKGFRLYGITVNPFVPKNREWDFTQGQKHADEVTDCEYWSASSKGRYALAKALDDQELPSNTGGALTDLDGIYFTVASGAVYGISQNFCFQNGKITVRIPDCGMNDELIVDFSGAGGEATVTSDNITSTLTVPSNISKQCDESKVSTRVKEDGDVVLNMSCGKGFRLYGIAVNQFVQKVRNFTDFAIDFTTDPYTVVNPADGVLPEGVTVEGTWHDAQHGYNTSTVTVPVDGAVKITFGNCTYNGEGAVIKNGDTVLATLPCNADCNSTTSWIYNSNDDAVLTIITPSYCPSLSVEACDFLPDVEVSYYNTDGKLIGTEMLPGGAALEYKYGADDVTVADGEAFRGWFASTKSTAEKVAEGTSIQTDTELFARATKIEEPTSTSRFVYDLTKPYFYVEDHEAIDIDGKYYNTHGWLVNKEGTIKVNVSDKCYVTVGCCLYSAESTATVTNEAGKVVAEFPVKAETDGEEQTFEYDGEAGWLTITFPDGAYVHNVTIANVVEFVAYDEESGYYVIPSGDVTSFLLALKAAASKDGAKIFLPDGIYDLGTTTLTSVTGKNISIIGESTAGTVILNYPPLDAEGISVTATLLNRSENLYLQDLTLRNAMPFDGKAAAGRAVTLQDKGKNTICKNVSLESYQDTYYSNNGSAYFYFEDGEIHGVVDYVCGGGDVYFNRVKFVNEAVKNATIAAPNGAKKYGYVMNNCTIETLCSQFNFGRSWGTYSGLAWLNTTINQPSKLASTRFNTTGMNCAADKFVEYNSMDADGNCISPASNELNFTHSSGDKKYETILTAEQAAEYAIDKVFPDWNPESIAAQEVYTENDDIANGVYLVDGKIYAGCLPEGNIKVRKANARGGFGPIVEVSVSGISEVSAATGNVVSSKYYNLQGVAVDKSYNGIVVKVDTLDNGKTVTSKIVNR